MVLAVIAEGKHPIPFRTRKLRPPTMRLVLPQGGKVAALPVSIILMLEHIVLLKLKAKTNSNQLELLHKNMIGLKEKYREFCQ